MLNCESLSLAAVAMGGVSPPLTVTAGNTHSATTQTNIDLEDQNGIIFTQVTSYNSLWTITFPVSNNHQTPI